MLFCPSIGITAFVQRGHEQHVPTWLDAKIAIGHKDNGAGKLPIAYNTSLEELDGIL